MIHTSELLVRIQKHFEKDSSYSNLKVVIQGNPKLNTRVNNLEINVSRMYSHVDFDFAFLELLSKALKTKKINVGDRWSSGGCETCDYGSSYSCTVHIRDAQDIYVDAYSYDRDSLYSRPIGQDENKPSVMIRKDYDGKLQVAPEFKKHYELAIRGDELVSEV